MEYQGSLECGLGNCPGYGPLWGWTFSWKLARLVTEAIYELEGHSSDLQGGQFCPPPLAMAAICTRLSLLVEN